MTAVPNIDGLVLNDQPRFDRGNTELAGYIWFGAARLAKGVGIALPEGTDQQRFAYVIDSLGVGASPAIYYDAADDDTILSVYPTGLAHPDECHEVSLNSANLTLDYIKNLLDVLHEQLLKTPTASELARDLWEDQDKCIPVRESEKGIQKILHSALTGQLAFQPVRVSQEVTSVMGRCDFRLDEQDPIDNSKWTYHAILELKVVKSFTHTGNDVPVATNKAAVTDGVDQANDYRNDHFCRMAALCCYDMRKTPDVAEAVGHEVDRAKKLNVALWAWPIYPTPKKARTENAKNSKAPMDK
ncbi:MAG: hypothetical protein HGA75_11825 [Thiobacillus sp.]|nr:hypothetical protein [Thiobacillus sp.]